MDLVKLLKCSLFDESKQEVLFKFLHACVDELCGCKEPIFHQFKNINWTEKDFNDAHKFILTLLHNPICLYIEEEKMPSEFSELPKHVQQAIITCIQTRRSYLTDNLLFKYSSKHIPTLKTFDWRLKYIIGSSKVALIKESLAQLDLILVNKQKEETLGLELNKEELDTLIKTLEVINR